MLLKSVSASRPSLALKVYDPPSGVTIGLSVRVHDGIVLAVNEIRMELTSTA
jgi:hypothetical protein